MRRVEVFVNTRKKREWLLVVRECMHEWVSGII